MNIFLNDSKPKGLIVSNKTLLDTVLIAAKKINFELQFIICFDQFENTNIPNLTFYDDLIEDPSIEPNNINQFREMILLVLFILREPKVFPKESF